MARVPAGFRVNPETGELEPIQRRAMSKRRFMARISVTEYTALNMLRIDPAVPLEVRAGLMALAELRDMADEIRLDDADTEYGVAVSINLLTTLPDGTPGRIPVSEASARVSAWLADYPQPGEPFP